MHRVLKNLILSTTLLKCYREIVHKLVVNVFATEVVKKTTNAIVLFQLFSCRLIFVTFYSLKFRAF